MRAALRKGCPRGRDGALGALPGSARAGAPVRPGCIRGASFPPSHVKYSAAPAGGRCRRRGREGVRRGRLRRGGSGYPAPGCEGREGSPSFPPAPRTGETRSGRSAAGGGGPGRAGWRSAAGGELPPAPGLAASAGPRRDELCLRVGTRGQPAGSRCSRAPFRVCV